MKAKRTLSFATTDGSVISLVSGQDISPSTPLYTVDRLIELDLIEVPVKPLIPIEWKDLRNV